MADRTLSTRFASPERASADVISHQRQELLKAARLVDICNAMIEIVVILNHHRQIVFCNRNLLELLGDRHPERDIYGRRPGEALQCIRACLEEGGCGTSQFCATCGAVNAILTSIAGRPDVRECRISQPDGEALDLLVRTTPLDLPGGSFVIAAITDISHEKRRRALERVFFHDTLNTVMGLKTLAHFLDRPAPMPTKDIPRQIRDLTQRLLREVAAQRDLAAAESFELSVLPATVRCVDTLRELVECFTTSEVGRGRRLILRPDSVNLVLWTDAALLFRVLSNMIVNALEATDEGGEVTLGCASAEGEALFTVHNAGEMADHVQLQLFQRSFSTKGPGRGLGTYSMKLLGERYLGGRVSFTSSAAEGTTFSLRLPPTIPGFHQR
jgi:signal transduction histidine kinase